MSDPDVPTGRLPQLFAGVDRRFIAVTAATQGLFAFVLTITELSLWWAHLLAMSALVFGALTVFYSRLSARAAHAVRILVVAFYILSAVAGLVTLVAAMLAENVAVS